MESWRGLNGEHGKTKLLQATLPIDIAEIIAREIYMGANRTTPPIPYKGNAILVRAASQIREIEGELVKLRIPYIVRGGRGLLGTEEVRDVLSYLRLAVNPNDYMAFTRAVSIPRRGIGKAALMKLREVADFKHNGNLIDACQIIDKLNAFVLALRKIQGNINDASVALDAVFNSVGYVDYLKEKYGHEPHKVIAKVENLKRLTMLVKGLTETGCVTTEDVVFRLTMEKAAEGDPQGQVIISTIHAAKGLEFYRVYVFGVVEGLLPHQFSMGSPAELDEERRLFYVAVTRARDMLILCVPSMVQPQNSSARRAAPSRFLSEVGIVVTRNPE
jgi:DNA helicase-2/ATP-dependent DNA helicase PcrA